MFYGSVCSGIEAASVAWHPLGWRAAFLSEIEPFPRAVLAHHFADVPLHGDFTTIEAGQYEPIDLLVGGTPCQSFSIAGLRGGLADDRGNLALEYCRLADALKPRWIVWENVLGVLSSNGGRDFGSILGAMGELGYGVAYRVLDAQHFGVPQRRRRVFVVGYSGDWRRAAAVLFERESLRRNPAPRRKARKDVAPTISARPTGGGGLGTDFDLDGGLIASDYVPQIVNQAMTAKWRKGSSGPSGDEHHNLIAHALRGEGFDASEDGTGRGTPIVPLAFMSNARGANLSVGHDMTPTLRIGGGGGNSMAVAFDLRGRAGGAMMEGPHDTANIRAASGGSSRSYVAASAVRRLTPRECERLQGFPDNWTDVPYRGKQAADGPRYKALGNSMAVPVMRWLGERIQMVEDAT